MVTHVLAGLAVGMACSVTAIAAERSPSRADTNPFVLRIAMAGPCETEEGILALAQEEVRRIWSRAGVTIAWVTPSELPYTSAGTDWLVVRCADAAPGPGGNGESRILPIAAIRFVASLPTNTVALSLANANALLRQEITAFHDPRGWAVPFRRIRLGRMLGRALAHEVGHFLSQSRAHTRGGLMRASHSVAALTGVSIVPFRVDPEHIAPLRLARQKTTETTF